MADTERKAMSRKDFKMESNSILKPEPGLFALGGLEEPG